ncbi:MAG: class I SAM-dependent methyltransferase, partial [Candidatus Bathyarchaeota archaeon]|nr:class I SAM-dependent methyltransferase [Candidatus Bathyarchaeota archaeon]
ALRIYAKYYDQIYLTKKDYQKEAETIKGVIKQSERKQSRTLLDVGCGTGEHLKYLSSDFQCTGIDINRNMIKTAKNKVPNAEFKVANMINFKLKERFDVIVCLFSSIGYVQTFTKLVKTLENFYEHLNDKGLVIVEPWIFKKDFKKGIYLDTYEDEKVKLVRMATSRIVRSKWLILMHYLIGEKGEIRHVREIHKMLALDHQDYIKASESTRFKDIKFLKEKLWDGCRGLFIATKGLL